MRRGPIFGLAGAVGLFIILSLPAAAGGWAVTTVDRMPAEFEADTAYQVDYSIRQHGLHLVDPGETFIRIWSPVTGEEHLFAGTSTGETGRFTAEVAFPAAGEWEWEVIQGAFGSQRLGSLTVAEAGVMGGVDSEGGSFWTSTAARAGLPLATAAMVTLFGLQLLLLRRERCGAIPAGAAPVSAGD